MPNTKRLTDAIREDMRAKYEAGEATQAELADLFNFSIPSVNKAVKGVTPVKRKYKTSTKKQERNKQIVESFNPAEGVGMKQLAEQFNMTVQNVSLILKAAGVNAQKEHFDRVREAAKVRKADEVAAKVRKQEAKMSKVLELSELWKNGCSIEEFRVAADVKSCNAAQVKVFHLRKQYGEDRFPRRVNRSTVNKEEKKEKAEQLSSIFKEDPTNVEALCSVFGDKPDAVNRRICVLRNEFGEELFPRLRKSKSKVEVLETVDELVKDTLEFVGE